MGQLTMNALQSQLVGLEEQLATEKLRVDNLTRVIRDGVKTRGSVKQKDSEGNAEYVSVECACDQIKP